MGKISIKKRKKFIKTILLLVAASSLISWDIYQANRDYDYEYKPFYNSAELNFKTNSSTTVGLVRSDNSTLANPSSIETDPSSETVEQMVRKAVELAGGLSSKISSGMKVLIKPNLVESNQASGSGSITDVRVVEALVKIIDEIDHGNIHIIVGDGSPRPFTAFERNVAFGKTPWDKLYGNNDPTKDAGYDKLWERMVTAGVDFRLTNLNGNSETDPWSELREVVLPNGTAQPQNGKYMIHEDVLDADVYITVPVMKIHDPGITCALKNQIGLAPSSLYGFSKTAGVHLDNYEHKLLHTAQAPVMWTDKEIVDLNSIAKIKFVVVDALMCLDVKKTTLSDNSNQVRMNMVLAGEDPVAIDNVCSRLMGLNPDDIEHITLAERMGLGTNDISSINILGENLDDVKKRFRKNTVIPDQVWGQGNREWLISQSFDCTGISDPLDYEYISGEAELIPAPGQNGWSDNTYFINDRIDLRTYFNSGSNQIASYAFTYFTSPKTQEAQLWVGSDEAIKIFINGKMVYSYNGTRSYTGSTILSEIKNISINEGMNTLLVKTIQKSGTYDFALNICEVESNLNFVGNRVEGLKFTTEASMVSIKDGEERYSTDFELLNCYPNPFNGMVQIPFVVKNGEEVELNIYNMLGEKINTLFKDCTGTNSLRVVYWNGRDKMNDDVASGTYLVVLRGTGGRIKANKILYLK